MSNSDFELRGADDFLKLSKALKHAGEKGVRTELNRGFRDATKPLLPGAAAAFASGMPAHLKGRASKVTQQVKVSTGRDPGVSIAVPYKKRRPGGMGASNARLANRRGQVRHPLFGNRDHWYSTPVPGSLAWFDAYYSQNAPKVLPELEKSLQRVVQKIVKEAS